MQFTAALLATILAAAPLALASPSEGFSVPAGTPDGVYSVHHNSTGHEVHAAVTDAAFSAKFARRMAAPSPADAASLTARGDSSSCNNEALAPADVDKANSMLDAQCGDWHDVSAYKNFYSVSGGVVAYFCNQSGEGYGCSNGARVAASQAITAKCGLYKAGWQTSTKANPGLGGGSEHWAYGYQNVNDKFCGDGINH